MACLLTFMHGLRKQSATDVLLWWRPEWGGVMVNREVRRLPFCSMGRVGVGEAVNLREERGAEHQHAHNVEMGRGTVCGCFVPWNRGLRSEMVKVAEMRWLGGGESWEELWVVRLIRGSGQLYWPPPQLFTAVKSSYWSIKLKTMLLTFDAWFLRCFGETWVVMLDESEQVTKWASTWFTNYLSAAHSVRRSSSVQFFAPKTGNRGPRLVQDQPRYWGNWTEPPRTGLLRSMVPVQTDLNRFFCVKFVVPI